MTEKELYISQYKLLTRIVINHELRLERAKREQEEIADQFKKYNISTKEMNEIYHELYIEVRDSLEKDTVYLKRKFQEGEPFKYDNMWVIPSAEEKRKTE